MKGPFQFMIVPVHFKQCDSDLKINLYNNIVLADGSTMMNGFVDRFEDEIKEMARDDAKQRAPSRVSMRSGLKVVMRNWYFVESFLIRAAIARRYWLSRAWSNSSRM